jgi:hypothetical protein
MISKTPIATPWRSANSRATFSTLTLKPMTMPGGVPRASELHIVFVDRPDTARDYAHLEARILGDFCSSCSTASAVPATSVLITSGKIIWNFFFAISGVLCGWSVAGGLGNARSTCSQETQLLQFFRVYGVPFCANFRENREADNTNRAPG